MDIKKVVVAGGGVLGSQIAYQSAFKGYDVTIWLRSEGSIGRAKPKLEYLHKTYAETLEAQKKLIDRPLGKMLYARGLIDDFDSVTPNKIDELKKQSEKAYNSIKLELDMVMAFEDADIVIEAMTENPEQKTELCIRKWHRCFLRRQFCVPIHPHCFLACSQR